MFEIDANQWAKIQARSMIAAVIVGLLLLSPVCARKAACQVGYCVASPCTSSAQCAGNCFCSRPPIGGGMGVCSS